MQGQWDLEWTQSLRISINSSLFFADISRGFLYYCIRGLLSKFFRAVKWRSCFLLCLLGLDSFQFKIVCMLKTFWGGKVCLPTLHISLKPLLRSFSQSRTSLAVQWLRICASTAGARFSPRSGNYTPHAVVGKRKVCSPVELVETVHLASSLGFFSLDTKSVVPFISWGRDEGNQSARVYKV